MAKRSDNPSEAKLMRVLGIMPFGALTDMTNAASVVRNSTLNGTVSCGAVANYLETLAKILRNHLEEVEDDKVTLSNLRAGVKAFRRLLGLPVD